MQAYVLDAAAPLAALLRDVALLGLLPILAWVLLELCRPSPPSPSGARPVLPTLLFLLLSTGAILASGRAGAWLLAAVAAVRAAPPPGAWALPVLLAQDAAWLVLVGGLLLSPLAALCFALPEWRGHAVTWACLFGTTLAALAAQALLPRATGRLAGPVVDATLVPALVVLLGTLPALVAVASAVLVGREWYCDAEDAAWRMLDAWHQARHRWSPPGPSLEHRLAAAFSRWAPRRPRRRPALPPDTSPPRPRPPLALPPHVDASVSPATPTAPPPFLRRAAPRWARTRRGNAERWGYRCRRRPRAPPVPAAKSR